jgi:SWI/SNF-related matrix-associated actin-dependent regulator of chromatin subfamily A member 5
VCARLPVSSFVRLLFVRSHQPVQVFRLVTEHTIEEKIVERAQQKLKLDAMVVQSGRLKDKDNKLSRDELLSAVRFGADKIFKSKDSSITDDDIDMILDDGKKKTQELNEKLKAADKGDLLDFKLDGSSVQTFDGVDYSKSALNKAKADAEMLGLFDIGKRERKEANYNENSLYKQQMTALQNSSKTPKKKKAFKLPKHLRLPRMEEWHMYDREALFKIQEEEENAFKSLPEEDQKLATAKMKEAETSNETEGGVQDNLEESKEPEPDVAFELPPLLSEEMQAEKEKLLAEGFSDWKRHEYTLFVKASATYGRDALDKIAIEVGKSESAVREFANSFWGEAGKTRIAEHEYDRVTKLIERGEKKIEEMKNLDRATRILVSHFDDPWEELEFIHVNCKDKMFTAEEDRHLLCWALKVFIGTSRLVVHVSVCSANPPTSFACWLCSTVMDNGWRSKMLYEETQISDSTISCVAFQSTYLDEGANS